jgi:hypothetical protein
VHWKHSSSPRAKNFKTYQPVGKNVRYVILNVEGAIHFEHSSRGSAINTNACWDMACCVCETVCRKRLRYCRKVYISTRQCTTNRVILSQYLLQSILYKLADNQHYYLGSWINTWRVIDSTLIKKRKRLVMEGCISTLWVQHDRLFKLNLIKCSTALQYNATNNYASVK